MIGSEIFGQRRSLPGRHRRWQTALLWLTLAWALVAAGCGKSPPGIAPLSTDAVILAYGDSLTYGTGATDEQAYPRQLQTLVGLRVVNAGVPGETTPEALERLDSTLREFRPELVVLCSGGNDMLRQMDRTAMQRNLEEMIRRIRASGSAVILLGVPEPKLLRLKAAPEYAAIADALEVPADLEVIPATLGERGLKSDAIHPNAAGYRRIAEAVARLLHDSGAI